MSLFKVIKMKRYISKELKEKVSKLLSRGFNCTEIAQKLKVHPVTVRWIKVSLKRSE